MAQKSEGTFNLVPCVIEIAKPVLCIGVDVAWFGGGAKNKESRKETIAWSLNDGNGWSVPEFKRIDLDKSDANETKPSDTCFINLLSTQ